ncbi:site-specific integrase [Sphingomonas sp.]|uniref:tyrosine-type recombinase/integrase n=1 Tax=Sphingomonas sp. TaxID=28214 RepID=UPI0026001985|nr:site-specific integrase [Sphingomonas sp.]
MAGLTALKVKTAKAGRHGDGAGLYLLVSETGARSWVLRVQVGGKRRDIGLGALSDATLEEARDKARDLRKAARAGLDPIAMRDKAKLTIPTFKVAAEACHGARKAGWKMRHADAFLSTLKLHVFPKIGSLRVDSIDEKDIVAVLSPLWREKPAAARKLRQRIGTVLDFAKGSGWRSMGAPRDGLRPLLSKQDRPGNFASMPYSEVPVFMTELIDKTDTAGRLALQFTMLTAARSGEVRSAMWSHVDLDARTWTRPASLMKNGQEHVITLSPTAIAVLGRAKKIRTTLADASIFPGSGGRMLSDMSISKAMRDAGRSETVHGFRSSFRTWAAEQMPTMPEAVCEAALAHVVPDQVVRAYQRAKFVEMRRKLLDAWGDFCTGHSNVLSLVG